MFKQKKFIIIFALLAIVIGFVGYLFINKNGGPTYLTAKVLRGEIGEEVLATGQVKRGEEIELGFRNGGTIIGIYVDVGEMVQANQLLAKVDTIQLGIQVQEARANLDYAQADLDKLLAGATDEEIAIKQALVESAQTNLSNAQKDLIDVQAVAEENLKAVYEDALNILDETSLELDDTLNVVDLVQRTYFASNDQESLLIKSERQIIEEAISAVNLYLTMAEQSLVYGDIDLALAEMQNTLGIISTSLTLFRESCELAIYRNIVSSADKTSLDNQRTYINANLTNIIDSEQDISSARLTNQSNINTAEGNIFSDQDALDKAEKDLILILAEPREEDIVLYQARVNQAQADVNLLLNQISEAKIFAPVSGQIARIEKEIGEIVQASTAGGVISLIPVQPFTVEIDIAETDIGKVEIGNSCQIVLDAFPEKTLSGNVIQVDPAETIIQGVVYYRVKVSLEDEIAEERIKPGMTAEVIILTALKQDALFIPQRAVAEKNGFKTVRVIKAKQIETIEIKTGIRSDEGMIEIISGLQEGDEVITFEEEKK